MIWDKMIPFDNKGNMIHSISSHLYIDGKYTPWKDAPITMKHADECVFSGDVELVGYFRGRSTVWAEVKRSDNTTYFISFRDLFENLRGTKISGDWTFTKVGDKFKIKRVGDLHLKSPSV
jgi:hypothetical protein